MKRVWRNLSKGKKIAGLVAICLAVVLGYFGYHRLTSQAEGQISKGVINDIAQLPKNMDAEDGTAENPFVLLEIVPYAGEAEIGYMIEGCEPIDFSSQKSKLYNNQVSIGNVVETVFSDEYVREKDTFMANTWTEDATKEYEAAGYYEKVNPGQGNFTYAGTTYEDTSKVLSTETVYRPNFTKVDAGAGDWIWVSAGDANFDLKTYMIQENKFATTAEGTIAFEVGDREYTTRKDTGIYFRSDSTQYEARRYIHFNQFLRTALSVRTPKQIEEFQIVVKTIEPWELNAYPEWIDYADLVYMHQGACSVGALTEYWNDSANDSLKRIDDTNTITSKNGVVNPKQTKVVGDRFNSVDDFSWTVAKKLFLKINALEMYDEGGQFPFAPMMFDASILNARDNLFSGHKKSVTHYPLDYTTMDAAKVTYQRGWEDNLGSSESAFNSNFYKFLIMNFLMKQENFHKYFFKNARKTTGECVIQENGTIGLHSSQDEGESQEYWSVKSFLPVPDTAALGWSEDLIKLYGINRQSNAFMNFNGNVALAGGTFTYNADNMFSQMFNNSVIGNGSNVSEAFQWYADEYGKNYGSISPVQMIHYLLNYRKKGTGDDEEGSRKKDSVKILEIEPCSDYILNETYLSAYLPPARFKGNIKIDYMTTQEFNGIKKDINGEYDLVYIGLQDGKLNKADGDTVYNDSNMAKKIVSHVGDEAETIRFSGNDISKPKVAELEKFVDGGSGLVLADKLHVVSSSGTVNVNQNLTDKSSNLYKFASSSRKNKANVTAISDLSYNFLLDHCITYTDSKVEVTDVPTEYESADGTGAVLTGSKLDFTFTIGTPRAKSEDEEDTKYGIKIFMDIDYDGVVADSAKESELVYDSYSNVSEEASSGDEGSADSPKQYYQYIPKEGNETDSEVAAKNTHAVSFDFNTFYQNRQQPNRRNGAIAWKFVVYVIDNPDCYVAKTGTSWYNSASTGKMEINVYQIIDTSQRGTAADLSSNPQLFATYAENLENYEINVETETLDQYLTRFTETYPYTSDIEYSEDTLSQFEEYNVFLVSCGERLQQESDNHGAVSFIAYQAEAGISVLYTGKALSKDSKAAAAITQDIKDVLNQSRFTDIDADYVDSPTFKNKTYSLDDYESLEYTYAAGTEKGDGSYKAFSNDIWTSISYGDLPQLTDKITRINKGTVTTYPYTISSTVDISDNAAQDYQLNMNNDSLTVWYCLGGDKDMMYGISPNDATNNYYLYSVDNVTYSGIDLGAVTGAEEMKLFINTLIGNYEIGYKPPHVTVNKIKGIESEEDDCLELTLNDESTDIMKLFDARMPKVEKQYLEYVPSPKPIATPTTAPEATLDPEETAGPEPTQDSPVIAATPKPTPLTLTLSGEGGSNNATYGTNDEEKAALNALGDEALLVIKYHNTTTYPGGEAVVIQVNSGAFEATVPVTSSGDGSEYMGVTQTYTKTIGEIRQKISGNMNKIYVRSSWWCTTIESIKIYENQAAYDEAMNPTAGESTGNDETITDDEDTTLKADYDQELASESTFIADALANNKHLSHRIYFTPYDNNIAGGNIRYLRISLVNKTEGEEDKVHSLVKTVYQDFRDISTGKRFIRRYKAGEDGNFSMTNNNFLKDNTQYYFLYDGRFISGMYAGVKYNYVRFDIENRKKKGTTYLNLFPDAQADNTYVFNLD